MLVNEEFNQISSFLVSFPGLFPSGSAWCELFTGANATREVKFLLFFFTTQSKLTWQEVGVGDNL